MLKIQVSSWAQYPSAWKSALQASLSVKWIGYGFLLIVPLSVFWPAGPPWHEGVHPMYVTAGVYLSDIGFLFLLLSLAFNRVDVPQWFQFPYALHLLALVILASVTIPLALLKGLALYTALRWLIALLLYVSLVRLALAPKKVAAIFVAATAVHAVVGMAQFAKRAPLGLPGELALAMNQIGTSTVPAFGTTWLRAYGLTFNPNVLGGLLTVGLLVGIPLLVHWRWRALWLLLWSGLLLSFSRSAWLAAGLTVLPAAAVLAWKYRKLRRPLLHTFGFVALFFAAAFAAFWPTILTRFNPTGTIQEWVSLLGRFELWKVALGVIRERPLAGVGAGNFPLAVALTDTVFAPDHAHNVPLQLAAEVGVLGAAVWLLMCMTAGFTLIRGFKSLSAWDIVWRSAWLALGIISLVDGYPWVLNAGRLLSVFVLAMSGSERKDVVV